MGIQQSPEPNRFSIKGKYQGSGGNRTSGSISATRKLVTVSLGGIRLTEVARLYRRL
ncbi:MAG: hypothetical protein R2836_06900 [Chitinophagales bacterium]